MFRMVAGRSEEHTSELQSLRHLVCRLLLEKNICGQPITDLAPQRTPGDGPHAVAPAGAGGGKCTMSTQVATKVSLSPCAGPIFFSVDRPRTVLPLRPTATPAMY